jgi:hypothetical protein
MDLTPLRMVFVLLLTIAMCSGAALLAIRKLRNADPADVF